MAIKIRIPTPLQTITKKQAEVTASGKTVKEALGSLTKDFSGIRERLFDDKGELRRFINFYVNDEDIRFLKGIDTPIKDGDEISIIPAIAGGAAS